MFYFNLILRGKSSCVKYRIINGEKTNDIGSIGQEKSRLKETIYLQGLKVKLFSIQVPLNPSFEHTLIVTEMS